MRPRGYRKSGFHGMERKVTAGGLSALDGRSALSRAVKEWRNEIASDLGGEEVLSRAQRTLLDVAAQDVVLLAAADSWLREHAGEAVNKRRRAFVPLVEQRLRVASHLADLLKLLGLKRTAKDVPRLSEYLATRRGPPATTSAAPTSTAPPKAADGPQRASCEVDGAS